MEKLYIISMLDNCISRAAAMIFSVTDNV